MGALSGKTVLVTRSEAQSPRLAALAQAEGAQVLCCPTVRILPPEDPAVLSNAARGAANFDLIVFTSPNAVVTFFDALGQAPRPEFPLVAAVGPATREAVEARGPAVACMPKKYTARHLPAALTEHFGTLRGTRVLLPRGNLADDDLPRALVDAGALVTGVIAYRTVPIERVPEDIRARILAGSVDFITFTSASTARGFFNAFSVSAWRALPHPHPVIVSIGPSTSAALQALGVSAQREAARSDLTGLIEALRG